MAALESRVDTASDGFRANRAAMLALVDEFRALEEQVRRTSNAKKEQFKQRGQLLPRERVALLLDKGSPFLELSTLAGLGMHDDDGKENVLGGGVIDGIGYVSGVRCLISASDSAIKGGTTAPMGRLAASATTCFKASPMWVAGIDDVSCSSLSTRSR